MFDFLKGGKAHLTLELDRTDARYHAGETAHAVVTVIGEKDLKIQQGRISFVYREEYERRYEGWERDSHGHSRRTTHTTWEVDERNVKQEVFLNEGVVTAGSSQKFGFDLPIPPNAPASCAGKIVKIKWLVKATLDRKMAGDVEQQIEIAVLSTPPGKNVQAGEFGNSNEPGEAELGLKLPTGEFVFGETIEGKLVIRPQKSFEVSEVRVELGRKEYVPRDLGHTAEQNQTVKLAGKTKLEAGKELELPFSIVVPSDAPCTSSTPNSSVTWNLKGILARTLRKDTLVEVEISIYSERLGTQNA